MSDDYDAFDEIVDAGLIVLPSTVPITPSPKVSAAAPKPKQRRRQREEVQEFVYVPVKHVAAMRGESAAWDMLMELLSQSWWDGGIETLTVSNQLAERAAIQTRLTRQRVLRKLEARSVISATQHGKQAPRATLLGEIWKPKGGR